MSDDAVKQKFKVGQIVVMKSLKQQLPFRIIGTTWSNGWFYQWNRKNSASESMIRELTAEEKGEAADALEWRWVPVSERLPDVGVSVLYYEPGHSVGRTCHDGRDWILPHKSNVTHWMPCPPPPDKRDE